ncbi:hypothetical protein NQ318_008340 [Aromia moschata]|uniref:PiggyBac transposable element-derived protein domain-containing protein n=1 Tax=Aromia moschata TaxID=1265417 RepID=A0AAV8XVA5_9CUCU|nr:hypothetical protein NQ318_008340 [Aromia moschata]
MWHFNDNQDPRYDNDRLRKITPLSKKLVERFQAVMVPENDTIHQEQAPQIRDQKSEEGSASANVVMSLMDNLLDSGRLLYTDNYYTSVTLASKLLRHKTHLVGTLRSNRTYNPNQVTSKKLKEYEVLA